MTCKIRHIAIQVTDIDKAAKFYEEALGLEKLCDKLGDPKYGIATMFTDGYLNIALLKFADDNKALRIDPQWSGLHHFGVLIEGEKKEDIVAKIEASDGNYYMTLPEMEGAHAEEKYHDPLGIEIDIADKMWPLNKM